MNRSDLLPYVAFIVDDALNGRAAGAADVLPSDTLVAWQCGFGPLAVAVRSYLPGIVLDADEAADLATDYLAECKWFSGDPAEPDVILVGRQGTPDEAERYWRDVLGVRFPASRSSPEWRQMFERWQADGCKGN